ncbi:MAG: sulfatase-like hydrolase/transferase, partial [Myxococcota bacterium]|nr:sulfatase-like hydrolase/transferase [Myxococcota bacterium]
MFARLRQLCAFGLLLLLLGCIRETTFPDVVLITLDTTRADALGCYGGSPGATPHLDALAERATLFANASAQAAVTPVSHASILTGLNPYTHGLRVMHGRTENRLADAARTLPEVLRAAGYRTAAFTSAFPVTRRFGVAQGFDLFEESLGAHARRGGGAGARPT